MTEKRVARVLAATLAAVIAACSAGLPAAQAAAPEGGPTGLAAMVRAEGPRLVRPDGTELQTRCINLGHWLVPEGYILNFRGKYAPSAIYAGIAAILGDDAPRFWQAFRDRYITEADLRRIAALGFNTVRLPFHYALVARGEPYGRSPAEGFLLLDRVVRWADALGLYVVLDMHAAPGGQTGFAHDDSPGYPVLFYAPAFQDETVQLWRQIASRYRDAASVLGYDLLNEPIAPYHDRFRLNPRLERLYRRIVAAIREADDRHLIFLGGAIWSTSFAMFGQPFDSGLVYTYHKFWADPVRASIQEYLTFRARYDVPVWLGESGEADDAWMRRYRTLHEAQNVGWCFWTYKNMGSTSTVASVEMPADWPLVVRLIDEGLARDSAPLDATVRARAAAALWQYIDNIEAERTTINTGYVEALGLNLPSP